MYRKSIRWAVFRSSAESAGGLTAGDRTFTIVKLGSFGKVFWAVWILFHGGLSASFVPVSGPDACAPSSPMGLFAVIAKRVVAGLLAALILLPIAALLTLITSYLLAAMQDAAGAAALGRIVLALGLLWAIVVVALLLALGINELGPPRE